MRDCRGIFCFNMEEIELRKNIWKMIGIIM